MTRIMFSLLAMIFSLAAQAQSGFPTNRYYERPQQDYVIQQNQVVSNGYYGGGQQQYYRGRGGNGGNRYGNQNCQQRGYYPNNRYYDRPYQNYVVQAQMNGGCGYTNGYYPQVAPVVAVMPNYYVPVGRRCAPVRYVAPVQTTIQVGVGNVFGGITLTSGY